jgi:addiction module HigA family antidote
MFGHLNIGNQLHQVQLSRVPYRVTILLVFAMKMHNPPHPGEIIRELCLEPLGLTITRAAEALGVSRKTLSAVLNGRAGVSPEMAIRLAKAFRTTPESWLTQQSMYDLAAAEKRLSDIDVEDLVDA